MTIRSLPTGPVWGMLITRPVWGMLIAFALAGAPPAHAAELTVSGGLSISGGMAKAGGDSDLGGGVLFPNNGDDSDSSPIYGGSLGYEFPVNEILPADYDSPFPLPSWRMRWEIEAHGGRDYELVTPGPDPYLTRVSSWAVLQDAWLDVPVHPAVAWAFGRVPLVEPLSFTSGAGIGLGSTSLSTSNNILRGKADELHFAWLVGAGFSYDLTERVALDAGYRYVDLGEFSYALRMGPTPAGRFTMSLASHEFALGVRVRFLSVASPGGWTFRRAR